MTRPTVTVQGVEDMCRRPYACADEAIGAGRVLQHAGWDVEWLGALPDADGLVAAATVRHPVTGDLVGHIAHRVTQTPDAAQEDTIRGGEPHALRPVTSPAASGTDPVAATAAPVRPDPDPDRCGRAVGTAMPLPRRSA